MELKAHQSKVVQEAKDKQGLFFKCRVGKTPTAIRLACTRVESALVICPKSLYSQWKNEIERWKVSNTEFQVYSKEVFRKLHKEIPKADCVIIDEAHLAFANHKNQTFKAMDSYLKKHDPKCVYLLTGTPKTSSSWSVYSYGKLLGRDWKWHDWDQTFFYKIRMGNRMVPMPKAGMDGRLQEIIHKIGTVIDMKDIMEVAEDEEVVETFTLNADQKRLIKDFFDPLPIVRFSAQHQLEQGVKKDSGYGDGVSISVDKDKRLLELVEQNEKIIIVCRYHDQIRKYVDSLKSLGRNIYEIHGQTKEENSQIACKAQNDPSAIVICQSDVGVGFDLKNFNTMVFASMSYNYNSTEQMKHRMKSQEKSTGCTYVYMLTEGESVDQGVYKNYLNKQDFDIELFKNKQNEGVTNASSIP